MKHMYYEKDTFTVIHTMEMFDGVAVTGIGVGKAFRGQGSASRVLKEVIEDADREGVILYLSIEPDGTGLDEDQLRAWYARNGFVNMDPELTDIGMIRKPQRPKIEVDEPLQNGATS